jgi:hypothetical protein
VVLIVVSLFHNHKAFSNPILVRCSRKILGGKSFISGSASIRIRTYMLSNNCLIQDYIFHNMILNANVLGNKT